MHALVRFTYKILISSRSSVNNMKHKFLLFIETPEKQIESHTERAMASVNVANCGNGFWLHFQFVGDNERLEVYECVDCVICAYKTVFCRIVCNGRKSKR